MDGVEDKTADKNQPHGLVVDFSSYLGRIFLEDDPRQVGILTLKISGWSGNREGFPVDCGVVINVHKAQGLISDKIWIDLGNKEFSTCLTYVAISRTTTLGGLRLADVDDSVFFFEETFSW